MSFALNAVGQARAVKEYATKEFNATMCVSTENEVKTRVLQIIELICDANPNAGIKIIVEGASYFGGANHERPHIALSLTIENMPLLLPAESGKGKDW